MKDKKLADVLTVILSAAAAVLMATPNAVLMRFANDSGTFYEYVSGFSMLPVGYGIWGAMAAGICSIVLAILGIANIIKENSILRKWMFGISVAALLMWISLLLSGSMTFVGILISVLLASETVLLWCSRKV